MLKNSQPVLIEAMEKRVLFDVSLLTETIGLDTLPAAVSDHAVLKGNVTVTVGNFSGADVLKAKVGVGLFISNGPFNPAGPLGSLGSKLTTLTLLNGTSKVFKIPVNVAKGRLADGVDTVTAVVAESAGGFSQSATTFTLTVHPPIVALSETETFQKLADSTDVGAKFHISDKVAITNSGTDPNTDPITIGIYATPDGIPADGSLMTSVTKKVMIPAGKTVNVPVNVAAIPALAVGSYKLVTQVTQTNGTITVTDPSTAPVITVTVPTTGPRFSDSIIAAPVATYTPEPLNGSLEFLATLTLKMAIQNSGTAATGPLFTLFASNSPTFDSSAIQIGQVPLPTLTIPPTKGSNSRTFFVEFGTTTDLNDFPGAGVDMYIFVQVTDPTGNITMASYPTPIKVGGPIVG